MTDISTQGEPVAQRIASGTGVDWWWHQTDCPVGTKLYTAAEIERKNAAIAELVSLLSEVSFEVQGYTEGFTLLWAQVSAAITKYKEPT